MSGRGRPNALAVLGLDPRAEAVYRVVLQHSGALRGTLANALSVDEGDLDALLEPLVQAGLVQPVGNVVEAAAPEVALGGLIAQESRRLRTAHEQLDGLRELLPVLRREHVGERSLRGDHLDGEVVAGGDFPALWMDLAGESAGEVLQIRPDQWRLPTSAAMDPMAHELMAAGRRFRTLYPAVALSEAPDVLRNRAGLGEEIRLLAELPSRLVVFGSSSAVVPQDWGVNNERRVIVRQQSLVAALTFLFERMWARAVVVPGLTRAGTPAPDPRRVLLLERMAAGDKDEQIARALGTSLRTVRRRIAVLQDELGASSRFQAGVEAVRRGWI